MAVVSTDVYRPAAIDQLQTLANEVSAVFIASRPDEAPVAIALRAVGEARTKFADVLIVDTAGRLAIDADMMAEIRALHAALNPVETLFVVDAMTGQDAANTAKAFNDALPLTGIVLAKSDGDARGGAALSVRAITGKPIKFLGVGEKTEALEPFHPDRIASRILGMGDVLSLIEEAERKVDRDKAERLARKIQKGERFDLEDFREQLHQMSNMGGVSSMLEKLPGMGQLPQGAQAQLGDGLFKQMGVIIDSMTRHERRFPDVINGSRKAAHRDGQRHPDPGHQPSAETAQADAEDDEEGHQEGRHGEDDAAGFEPQRGCRQPRAAGVAKTSISRRSGFALPGCFSRIPRLSHRAFAWSSFGWPATGRETRRSITSRWQTAATDVTDAISSAWASTTRSRAAKPNGFGSISLASITGCRSARSRPNASAI